MIFLLLSWIVLSFCVFVWTVNKMAENLRKPKDPRWMQ